MSGAVIATGTISPESVRFTIQHFEGGIIENIPVKEGQEVKVGDELVLLDDLSARADLSALSTRLYVVSAQEARLEAERIGAPQVVFPRSLATVDPQAIAAQRQEINRFNARRESRNTDKHILSQRITQARSQVEGYEKQLNGVRQQQALLRQESEIVEAMFKKGLERLPKRLALLRTLAEREGMEGELMANIAKIKEGIAELETQILRIDVKFRDEIDAELADVRARRIAAEEDVRKVTDRVERSTIRSPVNGTVLRIKFKTERGVVRPGEPIMEIVPSEQKLLVSARLAPRNIDQVRVGMEAWLVFPTYSRRSMIRVKSVVTQVSADVFQDEKTGAPYYSAMIEVDRDHLKSVDPQVRLQPGLPVEAYIATSERTMLEYLVQPLRMSFERGLREK